MVCLPGVRVRVYLPSTSVVTPVKLSAETVVNGIPVLVVLSITDPCKVAFCAFALKASTASVKTEISLYSLIIIVLAKRGKINHIQPIKGQFF